ncbi:MAG: M20/M25/M40 family metallo-hydrolase [Candidatus Marinimicrobia bacterium]|jgi:acetylornithine deacetylase/succinyl-diaminopimelate desuccinylase-like protein|nr:M20/M25/M40 family metallo-hydrolase [Candidatus Neomarinimicrobiota bacterium]MDP7025908.1 M20/M25/M40 family metallo-hydrolase [Candidatus Neomarinimicrobiota bacterium]|tara:strand:+ start:4200 stop:5372 length:1173 start_codon:yes stop_codon:yes gene_type:complete
MRKLFAGIFVVCYLLCFLWSGLWAQTKDELVHDLSTLIKFQTVTRDNEANRVAMEWVVEELAGLPVHVQWYESKEFPSVVITSQKTIWPKILLAGHMDVVPGTEESFHPRVEDGRLIGRGAYDMKMGIAASLNIFKALGDDLNKYDVGLMLTADEEIGGFNGVKYLVEQGYGAGIVVMPDGGFDWNFETQAKGVLWLEVTAEGKSAHGSRTWLGENAILKLARFLIVLEEDFATEKEPGDDYYTTVNIGTIEGGKATNQVPDLAMATVDIRYTPKYTSDDMLARVVRKAELFDGISVQEKISGGSHFADTSNPLFVSFVAIAQEVAGIEVGETKSHGASDARFFSGQKIPTMVIAGKGGNHHAEGEWVDIADYEQFYRVLLAWVKENGRK